MMDDTSKSLDILGVKPLAGAIEHASKATIDGASNFLSRICMPVAEEFGLLLQDKVRAYRVRNEAAILLEAEKRLEKHQPGARVSIHPRLLAATLGAGSWTDDDALQKMWAGLIASACSVDGRDDANLIFTDLMSRLTAAQVRIVNFAVETTSKIVSQHGLISPSGNFLAGIPALLNVSKLSDVHRLDIELDHLREVGLIMKGFDANTPIPALVDVTPTSLAMNLYVRCQGFVGPAPDYFDLAPATTDELAAP